MTNNLTNTRCGDYYIPNIKKGRLTEPDAKILQMRCEGIPLQRICSRLQDRRCGQQAYCKNRREL